jgi:hypothetical protein
MVNRKGGDMKNEAVIRKSSESILGAGAKSLENMFDDFQALALILDASGSMASAIEYNPGERGKSKDELQKEVVKEYIRTKLTNKLSNMKISVISFGESMHELLRDSSEAGPISSAIDNIYPGGSTYLAASVNRAAAIISRSLDYIPRIVITSDGQVHDSEASIEAVKAAHECGIIVDTIFIGANGYDEGAAFMKMLAQLGGGVAERVNSSAEFKAKYLKVLERKLIATTL